MATEVVMPQMGESIAEGTITRWMKKVGERVERDEPLFEISTDKVDAEIPSPAAGTLTQVLFNEGDTVEVNKVVAYIGEAGETSAPAEAPQAEAPKQEAAAASAAPASQAAVSAPTPPQPPAPQQRAAAPPAAPPPAPAYGGASGNTAAAQPGGGEQPSQPERPSAERTAEELRRTRSSPLVRKIAAEHKIDISRLEGTGISGRVTKNDILSYIESGAAMSPAQAAATQPQAEARAPQQPSQPSAPAPPPAQPGEGDRVEPMSVMRKKIAEHMTMSQRTSAHVATVYEIDMTRVHRLREAKKAEFQQRVGTKLSYMPFVFQAITQAIRKFPVFNSQVSGDQIIFKRDVNLGMAVALDWGLIVPVIKRADDLSIAGLAKAANDLAERARAKQLKPDEVAGGTFTITNPGVFGGLFGTPIINQPQVAILGVGTIEKRAKVITTEDGEDLIAVRHMAYFALSFDHRIIDGADAERFLSYVKEILEAGQFTV
ncbi:MAG TPA: 2-oxoglutarate dehydrogenase, E2 component, dihydrolipoamide succinyltransferase [Pyrinomonadaceae bacterium]|jgi:2-oxoglutarate dehydrogenase E2 component (dihydrolipoamide succinyltransferase)